VVEDKESIKIMKTVFEVMKDNPQITKLRIEGHTDNVGTDDANMKLSQGRAESVLTWLSTVQNIDKARLEAKGWGEHHPLGPNDNEKNKEQNRRVEFKIWEIDGKPTEAAKAEAANPGKPGVDPKDAKKEVGAAKPDAAKKPDDKKGATPAATPAKK
jgi:hypothetical protein